MKSLFRFTVLAVCVVFFACQKKEEARHGAGPLAAKPRFAPEMVKRGEALHAQVLEKTPDAKLDVWGSGFPEVKACLWIPEEDWEAFSPDDREALITYLKAQVPSIRSSPDRYTGIPPRAPVYDRIRSNIANMKDDAFIIFTMIRKDGQWIQNRTVAESK